jgi:hypothetical protein
MSILTSRELEFLASLRKSWDGLYRSELARLLKEDDHRNARDDLSRWPKGIAPSSGSRLMLDRGQRR